MVSNFDFLKKYWPVLAKIGEEAENYLYSDSNACIYKLGLFGERLVNEIFQFEKLQEPEHNNTQVNKVRILKKNDLIPPNIDDILFALRKIRNNAVHSGLDSVEKAKTLLNMTYKLSSWFMEVYGDWNFIAKPYKIPEEKKIINYDRVIKEQQEKINELSEKIEFVKTAASNYTTKQRVKKSATVSGNLHLSEEETRYIIDKQLCKVGWEADSFNLRYANGIRPQKGRNLAIAEWPTDSNVGKNGYADYALFVGLKLVAIIEAKAAHLDVSSVIDYQCKDYAKFIKEKHHQYIIQTWDKYKVPFVFATNGRPYLKQLETKSGIWFLDLRNSVNAPKSLQGWMSPEGMIELLKKDIAASNTALQEMPYDLLRDKDGLNLRNYQIRAIEASEKAVISGNRTALLAMATGTGKTRTILGMIYRFIKTNRFRRILFLVDRTALGDQAEDVFKEVKIEDLMTLNEIYNIKNLDDKDFDRETRIQIATVQSMVKRILYNEEDTMPSVTDYDLIVIDEAHRGYILDKEIGEDELLYRDQKDFISKYRTVVEYFDAVKIALTATPALHTTQIFGKPVFNYTYREAVIEGYLVDHDAPHIIKTKLNTSGIKYNKGESLVLYDRNTGEIKNSDELEDELNFDVEQFNRKVITEPFNRTVLKKLALNIDPTESTQGKTLIYAVDDQHADLIVKILKEIYSEFGVDNDAIMKITGSVAGGNKKKIKEAIKRFKNEQYPNIVVTVDLLTTGIDVPEITTLVFMRRVKSRILFEQMLGRATRLCPEIEKNHFEIYDPVGVYQSLEDVTNMKPVVANPSATFIDLLNGVKNAEDDAKIQARIDLLIAKVQRIKHHLNKKTTEHFADLTGGLNPSDFIKEIRNMTPQDAKQHLLNSRNLFELLSQDGIGKHRIVVISDKEDQLLEDARGYGNGKKPADYLDEFAEFIYNQKNEIAALNIVCTRPAELTRESLKSLKLELDREGFTEQQLNTAWNEIKNQDIAADIISLIRRYAIGSPLISHEERIKRAVIRLKKNHTFSKQEENWVNRMEKYLLNESILTIDTFNEGAFHDRGGFRIINKVFRGNLTNIVAELNSYLYDDGGHIA